ncbi:MAG: tRNA pseudouridine(38-40) synthase TruA [Phycisphaerales bacterium]
MPRYRLTLAYDGTNFCGWQKQEPPEGAGTPAGESVTRETGAAYAAWTPRMSSSREGRVALRTVQGVVEQAVREVVREPVELIGASRTDSGVHARGQIAAFSCEPRAEGRLGHAVEPAGVGEASRHQGMEMSAEPPAAGPKGIGWPLERGCDRLVAAINSRLPDDVLVAAADAVPHDFDPVAAGCKAYSYTFHCSRARPLWDRAFVHHVWDARGLNAGAMNEAGALLVGEHDFAAFAAAGHGRLSTVRRVIECRVSPVGPERVRLDITGNGFLWNMVRIIAGTLLQVGLGQRTPADVGRILEGRDRTKAGPTLPPTGLCLEWIRYGSSVDILR